MNKATCSECGRRQDLDRLICVGIDDEGGRPVAVWLCQPCAEAHDMANFWEEEAAMEAAKRANQGEHCG